MAAPCAPKILIFLLFVVGAFCDSSSDGEGNGKLRVFTDEEIAEYDGSNVSRLCSSNASKF